MAALCFVIPAFNAAATLGETLRSMLAQARGDWTAVVVDDGSADGTGEVARALGDQRVRVVRQENAGLAAARNRGWQEAEAEAVCFLDADDTVSPEFTGRMTAALRGHDAAACAHAMVGEGLEDLGWVIRPGAHDLTAPRLIRHNPLAVGAVVVRRDASARLGVAGALFDPSLRVHEDWDCWLRLTAAGARWAVVDEPLFQYRLRPGSMSGDVEVMWRVGLDVIGRAPVAAGLKPGASRQWTLRSLARCVARGDGALAGRLAERLAEQGGGLDSVTEEELGVIAGALKWALCQQERVGPRDAARREAAWRARVGAVLHGHSLLPSLLKKLDWRATRWDRVAAAAATEAGLGGVIVVYGVGRNGRALLHELAALDPANTVAWMDDDPSAVAPAFRGRRLPRLERRQLGRRHLVVVTPEEASSMGVALSARVFTPAELMGGAVTGAA